MPLALVSQARERTAAEIGLDDDIAAMLRADPSPPRAAAAEQFKKAGLPTKRLEAWHYTDLRGALRKLAPRAPAPEADAIAKARALLAAAPKLGAVRYVSVDGTFVAALTEGAPGVEPKLSPATAPAKPHDDDPIAAVMAGLAPGRWDIPLGDGSALIEIAHVTTKPATLGVMRLGLTAPAGGRVRLLERFLGAEGGAQRFTAAKISVGEGGEFGHVVMIDDEASLHVETQRPTLAKGASYAGFALVPGGALVRRQIFARLEGEGGKIALGGLSLIDGKRHADTTLEVVHAAPGGESREFYKHIVADEGVGVYQGKVIVDQYAQKTDGAMKSQAVLLSPAAQMMNKPELEIFADDVVCGHGATVAALDAEQIFYLQARGIKRADAEAMVLEAFGAEAILRGAEEGLHEPLLAAMRGWLARRGKGGAP